MSKITTAERVSHEPSDNFVYQRSLLAYHFAAERVEGRVLEIGTGSGYGVSIIAPKATKFVTLDKLLPHLESEEPIENVEMVAATVPPIPFPDCTFDCVVSFQVIEHIDHDTEFVAEVYRVLKPNGRFIVSTPNAPMSLTRNPWHVREYTPNQFAALLGTKFDPSKIEQCGVEGGEKVMEYYEKNRAGVERITRFDIFDFQHRLPRRLLQIPYDILNRINRKRLLKDNQDLTQGIEMSDYSVTAVSDRSFDLLYIAQK
ncbi:MAG: class I SAM-dependent methyltransferase [Rikenellaceae bacterium]